MRQLIGILCGILLSASVWGQIAGPIRSVSQAWVPTAVAYDNTSLGSATSGTTVTFSHTVGTGSNRLLIVCASQPGTSDSITATYAAVAMTSFQSQTVQGVNHICFYKQSPTTGANNVVVTFTTTCTTTTRVCGANSVSFANASQSAAPVGANFSAASGNLSGAITTEINGHTMDSAAAANSNALTVGGSQTQRQNQNIGTNNLQAAVSTWTTPPTTGSLAETFAWTHTSSAWSQIGITVAPASFLIPAKVTQVWLTMCAGGGGGAGGNTVAAAAGGGGASGECLIDLPVPVTAGNTLTVVTGTGSVGATAASGGAPAVAGGLSSVAGTGLGTIAVQGGKAMATFGAGGAGGGAAGGTGGAAGAPGTAGALPTSTTVFLTHLVSGGGGGGGGNASASAGGNGAASPMPAQYVGGTQGGTGAANSATGGAGAGSLFGSGGASAIAAAACSGKAGSVGTGYAAGGGGGCGSTTGGANGGNGSPGIVVIRYIGVP